jgi:hypothetical protein
MSEKKFVFIITSSYDRPGSFLGEMLLERQGLTF